MNSNETPEKAQSRDNYVFPPALPKSDLYKLISCHSDYEVWEIKEYVGTTDT
jgi:hypothetical protein